MLKAAVLGATGMVGQIFVRLLEGHPWFETAVVAASERSRGLKYKEATRWRFPTPIPEKVADLEVVDPTPSAVKDVDIVFSALPAEVAGKIEEDFAKAGYTVLSNASSHRMDPDVPLLNPEVNGGHISLIDEQRRRRKWDGAIVTNPNCSTAIMTLSLKPIYDTFGIKRVIVSTMQALSGAGYPGVASLDIVDNVIPYISKEEEKMQTETLKILGEPSKPADFRVSASCHRVATLDGHMEAVFVEPKNEASPEDVAKAMNNFIGEPQKLKLPTAPAKPIVIKTEEDRPQVRLDRMEGGGMSVTVGRIRKDPALDGIKYIVLGHNTIRGAAGCSILNAEYLKAKKYL
ncbi:MAG: aspartate-semialdehyde dehydrogenase [Nitrososphaerota archaeon]|nr:aspartate-semialdehyde dehydrogenase [Candidatus Bathyarchaeota archaeon]MDW8193239.1 aspartate-semialdehyde dehydrogenase [Nitrososphaerota archaeon]